MLSLRLALRDLRGAFASFRLFLVALAIGVAAIAAVGNVTAAIEAGLARSGAELLGGDAEVELTYRFATPDERAFMEDAAAQVSEVVSFRSLATTGDSLLARRALTEVRAVDDSYPLLGAVELDPPMPLAEALAGDETRPGAVVEEDLARRLSLAPGDTFRLGTNEFRLAAILTAWPDDANGGFGLGPRTLLRTADLEGSGLITEGTLFSTLYRLVLPSGADAGAIGAAMHEEFPASGLRWRDASEGLPGTEQVIGRVGAFLMLMGLAGLAIGGVGVSVAVRSWLAARVETIATLRTLGATRRVIVTAHLAQILLVTLAGTLLGLVLGTLPLLLAAPAILSALPLPAIFGIYPAPLAQAALYGGLVALLFALWPLARIEDIRPATLWREGTSAARRLPRWPWLAATCLVLLALVYAAIRLTGVPLLAVSVLAGMAVTLGLLALAALLLRASAHLLRPAAAGRPGLRLALASIGAKGGGTVATVLALGLGLATLAGIGQIEGNLRQAILSELPRNAPSAFLVDIQPDQIAPLQERMVQDISVQEFEAAPMLRGIITAINGEPTSGDDEAPWVLRGDRGVTYAPTPPDGTVITAGEWWPEDYSGPPQMSFSAEEAESIGLQLGDTVSVNILGREVTATVTSFRRVEFQTLGIGFVIVMNPQSLAGAPHSWIATVRADEDTTTRLIDEITTDGPNITAISIRGAAERVSVLLSGAATAIRIAALVMLTGGLFVLIGVVAAGGHERRREAAVARSLGASRALMLRSFALRITLLGLASALIAIVAGMLGGWGVSRMMMEMSFRPIWSSALLIVAGGVAVSALVGVLLALPPLSARPAPLLRARE